MGNWSWLEVVWTLVAVLGAYFSYRNIKDGLGDIKSLRLAPYKNGRWKIVHLVARRSITLDTLRIVPQIMFIMIGLLAGITPQNAHPTPTGMLAGYAFIAVSLLYAFASALDHNTRKILIGAGMHLEADRPNAA